MRCCSILFTIAIAALAQQPPPRPGEHVATIAAGVPLRVVLENRVAIKTVGEPIQGRLVEPIYAFDRMVLPAGTVVEGHIAQIGGVPAARRIAAILSGNLTPRREVRAQFDNLLLPDGARVTLRTSPSRGAANTVRIGHKQADEAARTKEENEIAKLAFRVPGKMSRLKSRLLSMLPYHRQAWQAGTLFTGVLEEPLLVPASANARAPGEQPSVAASALQEVDARLLTALDSANAHRGEPVEAIVTRPLFAADHTLLIPEGTRLVGEVVAARPARFLHRGGKLLFQFRQIQPPSAAPQRVEGYLDGLEAGFDAHLAIDSEGQTLIQSPKTRFLFPAIATAAAGLSLHQDYDSHGVPDQDLGGRAEAGAVGLGLIGTVVAQISRPVASTIAFTGAGFSIYSAFLARGADVILPANTPLKVSLKPSR